MLKDGAALFNGDTRRFGTTSSPNTSPVWAGSAWWLAAWKMENDGRT